MKNFFLILSLALPLMAVSGLSSSEIEFKNGANSFQVAKSSFKLAISEGSNFRSLDIRNCNQKMVEQYWKDLLHNVESVQNNPEKKNPKLSTAWVQYEKVKYKIAANEPAFNFFSKVPQLSNQLFAESRKLCKEKIN